MPSTSCITFLFPFVLSFITCSGQVVNTTYLFNQNAPFSCDCKNTDDYAPLSHFQFNLNSLLNTLSSNADHTNFYNAAVGKNTADAVYGFFLCRGDLARDACKDCVATANLMLVQNCPTNKEAVIWYEQCMLRYSNNMTVVNWPSVTEYAMGGLYSVKSDVFSFGILVLEILTGRKNFLGFHPTTSALTLLSYAWELWNEEKVLELMDPLLKDSCSPNELLRYIHIGLLCVQEDANTRPTMSSVVLMLKSQGISLSKPERPAFFTGRSTNDHGNTLRAPISCSVNDLTISDHVPR